MKYASSVAVLFTLLGEACLHTSPPPARDPGALSPLGVHGDISVGSSSYSGELLTLSDVTFVVLTRDRVVVIPFAVALDGKFGSIGVQTYGAPWPTHAEQLRYASRYPYGIPAPALSAILKSKGQVAPDTVKVSR